MCVRACAWGAARVHAHGSRNSQETGLLKGGGLENQQTWEGEIRGSGKSCCIGPPNRAQGNHPRLRRGEQGSHFAGPTVRLPGPGAHGCQPRSLLGNTQHHLHSPRSKSRYFITSFFLFKSKLKINVPSVLRCISLVQPAHIPARCPFQNMAGERRKEMDREREPVHPASMPVGCTSSKRETLQAWPRRRVESAQKAAGTRESGRRANSQNFQPSLHPILLQDLGQIAHPICAPIYSS